MYRIGDMFEKDHVQWMLVRSGGDRKSKQAVAMVCINDGCMMGDEILVKDCYSISPKEFEGLEDHEFFTPIKKSKAAKKLRQWFKAFEELTNNL